MFQLSLGVPFVWRFKDLDHVERKVPKYDR